MATASPEQPGVSACAACGVRFTCGAQAGEPRCWCFDLPKVKAISGAGCLCPRCLEEQLKKEAAA